MGNIPSEKSLADAADVRTDVRGVRRESTWELTSTSSPPGRLVQPTASTSAARSWPSASGRRAGQVFCRVVKRRKTEVWRLVTCVCRTRIHRNPSAGATQWFEISQRRRTQSTGGQTEQTANYASSTPQVLVLRPNIAERSYVVLTHALSEWIFKNRRGARCEGTRGHTRPYAELTSHIPLIRESWSPTSTLSPSTLDTSAHPADVSIRRPVTHVTARANFQDGHRRSWEDGGLSARFVRSSAPAREIT